MNNATGASALREFLLGLVEGVSARKLPAVFRSLARRTLGSAPSEEAIDDVVSAFLLKLVEATQRNSPGSARNLLLLEDAPLLRVVRYRLKQVACEQYPRWGLVKSLRAQVRRAMAEKLPTGVETLPETLLSADRLCSIRVAEATAFVLGQPDPPRRTVPDVSEHLLLLYFPAVATLELDDQPAANDDIEEEVAARLDAPTLASRFQRVLGRELTELVALRRQGRTLREVADGLGLGSVTTAHAHLRAAETRLCSLAKRGEFSAETSRRALAELR